MAEELTDLWAEAEQHLRALEQLARCTVEGAWLAGERGPIDGPKVGRSLYSV